MFAIFNIFSNLTLPVIVLQVLFNTSLSSAQVAVEYPLHVGDYWEYNNGFTAEVVNDTVLSNGLTYAHMVSTGVTPPFSQLFQRQVGDSIFRFHHFQDVPFYDFSLAPGDTLTILDFSDTLDIILQWTGTVNIFGKQRRQWEFFLDVRHYFDEEETHWITDSLGLTKWTDWFYAFSYTLQGAVINGDTFGVITAIEDHYLPGPSEFGLSQNYPNPFNANTQIRFVLPKANFVLLKIYDVLGEEVTTLLSDKLNPGNHVYNWDASELSSGIYYCHFLSGDFNEVKKMILMK